ncbi:IS66 family transposase [Pedobacter sp. JY14-1]|uniref:IS66 family transposase n=1 Tax=Pedobacter sp. JY14-1 TaxID=3034151 RepID=UPI0023E2CB24|nr:IS66 family transposase [Pedobacter sp. JY14-1]
METVERPSYEAFMASPEIGYQTYLRSLEILERMERMEQSISEQQTAASLVEELAAERERSSRLQFRVLQLERMIFGKRSEKLGAPGVQQLSLDIQAEEIASCQITDVKAIAYNKVSKVTTPKAHPGRNAFPAHLRREDVVLMPYDYEQGDVYMGEEVTETLEYTSGEIWVKRTVRRKYVKHHENGDSTIKIADLPVQTLAGATLLSHLVTSKYIDSLPIHRQLEIFKRSGITLSSATVSGWMTKVCTLLEPLYELLKQEVLKAEYLNVDETTMKVIDKKAKLGKTHCGWFWVYLHHWGKLVFFDYKATRSGEVPASMLKDYRGYIQADGYTVYENVSKQNGNTLLCCMAHVRRKFHELLEQKGDVRVRPALALIGELYAIEADCRERQMDHAQIKAERQQRSVPVLNELEGWLRRQKAEPDNDKPLLAALNYALNRWDKLTVYVQDGRLQIDNNAVERAIRTVAVGRKNYMFSGSHEGAQRSAMLYSLTATCKLNGLNPMVWLTDVLERLPYLPKQDSYLEMLLPHNWQPKPAPTSNEQVQEH